VFLDDSLTFDSQGLGGWRVDSEVGWPRLDTAVGLCGFDAGVWSIWLFEVWPLPRTRWL